MLTRSTFLAYFSCLTTLLGLLPQAYAAEELPALTVMGQETANQRPVSTYETPISNLDFDPRVDMQSRNMAEAQGDLSIRGGTFENTGVQVGSATLLDPQTGHYTTELPIAPEMLSEPKVLTGADNALRGFNSSVGTVSFSWSEITKGGSLTIGGGDHDLNFQRIHHALTGSYGDSKDWSWGAEIEGSRSEGDGTIPYGDHAFDRTSGRIQLLGPDSQTDLFAGYQEKFFGWPEMYAAPYGSNETEFIKTRLFILNHRQSYGDRSHWESSAQQRRINDHYIYNRFNPNNDFLHETEVSSISFSGLHEIDENLAVNYVGQFMRDEIQSTKLDNSFKDRNYYKLSVLPEYIHSLNKYEDLTFKLGASLDDTNRNNSKISPIAEIRWYKSENPEDAEHAYFSYSQATKVLGYGAIGGPEKGLFASNKNLLREVSENFELGYGMRNSSWTIEGALFLRSDDNLVDWTFNRNKPNSRSAKNVDVETIGLQVIGSRNWGNFEAIASYSYLKKKEDYKDPSIDSSFYALNFPEHRATLGFIWNPSDLFEFRVDNEWREQRKNFLRQQDGTPEKATNSHLAASYYPSQFNDLELFLAYDKPWDEDFQDIPGTPGRGDQFSFGATYSW
jgi:vitamin B12 transporter